MSALPVAPSNVCGDDWLGVGAQEASVVDIRAARSRLRPTVSPADTRPVVYKWAVPLYVRALGWVAAFALVATGAGIAGSSLRAPYAGPTWTHTVASGESLWGIAQGIDSSRPLGEVVETIRELNGLDDATLHPGQQLVLPSD